MLQQQINDKWKEAYKARNMLVKSAFESIKARILVEEKSGKHTLPLSDDIIYNIIMKEVKELKETQSYMNESDQQYLDLQTKINALSQYLPKQMSEDEVKSIILRLKDMEPNKGKLIGLVIKEVGSRFDKSKISAIVNAVLCEAKS